MPWLIPDLIQKLKLKPEKNIYNPLNPIKQKIGTKFYVDTEDGDGESVEQAPSRIKKGKQGKQRTLKCVLKDKKTIECRKGTSTFNLISQ